MCKYMEKADDRNPLRVAEWFPDGRRWAMEDMHEDFVLLVQFMDVCPEEWKYGGERINEQVIQDILDSTWQGYFLVREPAEKTFLDRFQKEQEPMPHIRVTFKGMYKEVEQCSLVVAAMNKLGRGYIKFNVQLGLRMAVTKNEDWLIVEALPVILV
jgi:hypothetical protein